MGLGSLAGSIGRGLVAGAAGTAAITGTRMLDMKLRNQPESTAPAEAGGKVLGVQPRDEAGEKRFSNVMHWSYGMAWGGVRGVIGAAGLDGLPATLVHFAAVSGAAMAMLPTLDVAPPVTEQPAQETALDTVHHLAYAAVTGIVYELLENRR
jgi:hypothetical protein